MIRVLIPENAEFSRYENEIKNLYKNSQAQINDPNSFEFIRDNTFFYMFLDDDKLIGGIYYFVDEAGKLFLNGFANRKMFEQSLECLKLSTGWFDSDIYAEAQNRASALCLLRCGFRRFNDNIFILKVKSSAKRVYSSFF